MQEFYTELGRLLRRKREACGLSHEKLAGKLGLSRVSITNIEAGNQRLSLHHALQLCSDVGIEWHELDTIIRRVRFSEFVEGQKAAEVSASAVPLFDIVNRSVEIAAGRLP